MAQTFTGNATIASGNGTPLLASSTIIYANGTRVVNGASPVYWTKELVVNAGANSANIAFCAAGNTALAANVPFGLSLPGIASSALIISPSMVTDCQGAGQLPPDANQTFFAASASTVVQIMGH